MILRDAALLAGILLFWTSPSWAQTTVWGGQFIEASVAQPRTAPLVFTTNVRALAPGEEMAPSPVFRSYPDNDVSDEIQNALGVHNGQMDFYTARFEKNGASNFTVGANEDGLMLKAAW